VKRGGFFILACLLWGALTLSAQDNDTFATVNCPFEMPEGEIEGETIECLVVTVPESRSGLSDAAIELALVVLHSTGSTTLEPVLYLAGGPGNSGTNAMYEYVDDPVREVATLIFLDQRGTGFSFPSLDCPEVDEDSETAMQDCYHRLVDSGVALDAYRTAENAADVNDVISALQLESVTLYGISYGTRLALTVMKEPHPAIRAVILDGVYPLNVYAYEEDGSNIVRVFNLIFEQCGADTACNAAFPDLETAFYMAVENLNAEPLLVTDEEGEDTEFTGSDLIDQLFSSFYHTDAIPYAPAIMYAAFNRDAAALEQFSAEDQAWLPADGAMLAGKQEPTNDGNSEGMFTNVECADEVPFNRPDVVADTVASLELPPSWAEQLVEDTGDILSMCDVWTVTPSDASIREATVSDLPTLIVNGEYDPVTPPHWAEEATATLSQSYVFIIPAGGHGVLELSECTVSIADQFLTDPYTEPDGSCVEDMPPPAWYVDYP
jgi:pimeloyl-ACP methyl ester carboxylesterase